MTYFFGEGGNPFGRVEEGQQVRWTDSATGGLQGHHLKPSGAGQKQEKNLTDS